MRKIYIARNCENTVNTNACPIIFVPDVMGTRLQLPDSNGINYKWDVDSSAEMLKLAGGKLYLLGLQGKPNLNPAGKREVFNSDVDVTVLNDDVYEKNQELSAVAKQQGFTALAGDFYRKFLMDAHNIFKNYGMPVYAVGYDWRQSNKKSAQSTLIPAINKILETEQAEKCIILTHSMGGLVTRAAIKQSKELEAKVLGVIHVVQPVFGAAVLYRRFFTGTIRQYDSTSSKPMPYIKDKVLFSILGTTPKEFGENMSSLQGPMELLLTDSYIHNSNSLDKWLRWEVDSWSTFDGGEPRNFSSRYKHNTSGIYDEYSNQTKSEIYPGGLYNFYEYDSSIREKLLEKLTTASAFHQLLGSNGGNNGNVFKHPNTYAIAGTGLKTDVATEFDLKFESVRNAVTYSQFQFAREERYNPSLDRIKQFSRVPMAERKKFVEDILLIIGGDDFTRLTKPIKPLEGDGTVPQCSAWGLFPDESGENKLTAATFKPRTHRQLTVSGVEHGDAYNSEVVTSWVHKLIAHVRNSSEVTQAVENDEERKRLKKEQERKEAEEERKRNWGKGGWRRDV